jgi:hypothetical protein
MGDYHAGWCQVNRQALLHHACSAGSRWSAVQAPAVHDDAHDVFMTFPPYIKGEDEGQLVAEGVMRLSDMRMIS